MGALCKINWLKLLGNNGWRWKSDESIDEDYSLYDANIFGHQYNVRCCARVADNEQGYNASGDYGVVWIECDLSAYTNRKYYCDHDAKESLYAIDHAETNLLKCGIPFTADYSFSGRNASNKARRNMAIRRKLGLEE